MLTPSTPVATPFPIESTNTVKSATIEANARAAVQAQLKAGAANETRVADLAAAQTTTQQAATAIPDPMASLSTVAVAGAMHSLPAALGMLQRIALASASGTLSDADRQNLQAEHAQLTAKVVSAVGSVGAGEPAQSSTAHEDPHEGHGADSRREDGGHPRPALSPMPVTDAQGPSRDARVELRAPAPRVDAKLHEPAAPASLPHAGAQHAFAGQAAQVTQFVQVARTGPVPPLVAVA